MKKIILVFIILILLTGCSKLYNLSNFILPNDAEFLALIQELDTPEKACQHILDNFEYEAHPFVTLTPYQLYLIKKGDCNDFTAFILFAVNYHGYETYQILIFYPKPIYPKDTWHTIPIFKEGNCYTFAENQYYKKQCYNSFKDIMSIYNGWTKYTVYDYDMNIVEQGENN